MTTIKLHLLHRDVFTFESERPLSEAIADVKNAIGNGTGFEVHETPVGRKVAVARSDLPDTVGERMAFFRKERGWSQATMAEHLDRSESWVSQVERGIRPVDRLSVLQVVADAFGLPLSEFLPGPVGEETATVESSVVVVPAASVYFARVSGEEVVTQT